MRGIGMKLSTTRRRGGMFAGLLLAAAAACDRPGGETASASGAGEKALHVRAVKPSRREVVRRVLLPATVRADMEVTLYNKVAGYVKTIIKDRGDRVKTGELIAKIEIPEMRSEEHTSELQSRFGISY